MEVLVAGVRGAGAGAKGDFAKVLEMLRAAYPDVASGGRRRTQKGVRLGQLIEVPDLDVAIAALKCIPGSVDDADPTRSDLLRFARMHAKKFGEWRGVILACVQRFGALLEHATADICDDREVVAQAVESNPFALAFASRRLQGDKELVLM